MIKFFRRIRQPEIPSPTLKGGISDVQMKIEFIYSNYVLAPFRAGMSMD